ncbi:MAG: hypothetical protein VB102_11215 [Paludibacter sp.]|nr:hypothetical protein [Paludibacter sp.]
MLEKLSCNIFKKRVQRYLRTSDRKSSFVNYTQAKTILLIFESNYSEKNSETKRIIESLTTDGKKVVAIGYVNKKNCLSATYPEYRVLCKKDLVIFQKPNQNILEYLLNCEYDLLIDITKNSFLPLEYVVLYANAKCKAGMQKSNLGLYDFAVDIQRHLIENEISIDDLKFSFLFDQILFYLKNIQSKDY